MVKENAGKKIFDAKEFLKNNYTLLVFFKKKKKEPGLRLSLSLSRSLPKQTDSLTDR